MTEDNTQDEALLEAATKEYYAAIMAELVQSDRFLTWFNLNFEIHKVINTEEKTIEIRVLEVHPDIVHDKVQEEVIKAAKEEQTKIKPASQADVKRLIKGKK